METSPTFPSWRSIPTTSILPLSHRRMSRQDRRRQAPLLAARNARLQIAADCLPLARHGWRGNGAGRYLHAGPGHHHRSTHCRSRVPEWFRLYPAGAVQELLRLVSRLGFWRLARQWLARSEGQVARWARRGLPLVAGELVHAGHPPGAHSVQGDRQRRRHGNGETLELPACLSWQLGGPLCRPQRGDAGLPDRHSFPGTERPLRLARRLG